MFREHLFDDGRTDGRMDGRTDGRRTDGRKKNPTVAVRIAEGGSRGGREPPPATLFSNENNINFPITEFNFP